MSADLTMNRKASRNRDRFVKETTACPGARLGSWLHRLSSRPPMDRRRRLITLESLILCRTQLLISPRTSSGRVVDDVLLVDDGTMVRVMRLLFWKMGLVVEPAGAAGVVHRPLAGLRVYAHRYR